MNRTVRLKSIIFFLLGSSLVIAFFPLRNISWEGNAQLHTLMETMAALLAIIIGILALLRYYSQKTFTILFIGVAFLGTALLDGYHSIVTSAFFDLNFPSPPPSLVPWSWNASRTFLATLLFISWVTFRKEKKTTSVSHFHEYTVYLGVTLLTFLFFLFFAFSPLPKTYYPELTIHRPEEFIAAFFLLLTLVGYLQKGHWQKSHFDFWLILSLIIGLIGQAVYMPFSSQLFDIIFDTAHVLKIASYICILIGLLTSVYYLYQQANEYSAKLLNLNNMLNMEMADRKLVEESLLQSNRELALLNQSGKLFNSSLDLDLVLTTTLEEIRKLLGGIACSIWLQEPETGNVVCQQAVGPNAKQIRGQSLSLGQGIAGKVTQTNRPIILADTRLNTQHEKGVDQQAGFESRSILSLPLTVQDEVIGALQVVSTEPNAFTVAQQLALEPVVSWAAIAIQNARLYTQAQQEIYERILAEAKLEHNQVLFQKIMDESNLMIFVKKEQDLSHFWISKKFEEAVGINRADVLGKTNRELFGEEIGKTFDITDKEVLSGQRVEKEESPDGENVFWSQKFTIKLPDGSVYLCGISTDITERKKIVEKIRQRATQLEILNEIGKRIASMLDTARVIKQVVNLVHERLNYHHVALYTITENKQELIMKSRAGYYDELFPAQQQLEWGQGIVGWVAQHGKPLLLNDVQTDSRYVNFYPDVILTQSELSVPILIGSELMGVLDIQSPQRDAFDTNDQLVMETLADQVAVSVQNARLYTALAVERTSLSQRVAERTAELEIANEEMAHVAQAKNLFLANMSHELRTPLNGILGYASLLQKDPNLTPQQKKGLGIIHQSGDYLLTLVSDILDMSSLDASSMELHPIGVHLPTLLKSVADFIRVRAQQKQLSFNFTRDDTLPKGIKADSTQLRQILHNLLSNAVKFTKQGKIDFRVHCVNDHQSTSDQEKTDITIRFEVIDTGIGIPQADLRKIFMPFERAGEEQHQVEGTGLGLAISYRLVRLMGGDLHVTSHLNKGSTFWFDLTFPIIDASPVEITSEPDILGYKGKTQTVLIVDDQPDNRSLLIDLLQPLGFSVVSAENGLQAIEQAKLTQPNVILMDLRMPVLDGYEAIAQIKQLPDLSNTKIIAISAGVDATSRERSDMAGSDDFLVKPVDWSDLSKLLEKHLQLDWIFAHEIGAKADRFSDKEAILMIPPKTEMLALHELAVLGNMRLIQQRATYLINLDKRYEPFAHQLRDLADAFQEKAILALVEQHMNKDEDNNDRTHE